MNRDDLIALFLARHGYVPGDAEPLAQDAGFRRYLRIRGNRPAVLMDAPPPEDVRPFLRIAAHLRGIGVSVPAILAADERQGLVLEQDLGDDLLSVLLDGGEPAEPLFDAAVDALVIMQSAPPPANLPLWDAPTMATTAMGTLFDWWWPAQFGAEAPATARDDIGSALAEMLKPVANGPTTFVHRDYFAGNLLRLGPSPSASDTATATFAAEGADPPASDTAEPSIVMAGAGPPSTPCAATPGKAPTRVGVIDFQGAALGHPAYDLVSLLQDARRDIPRDIQDRAVNRYLVDRPDLDPAAFRAAFTACAAQRHLRVACQWVRLALRDNRPHYLAYGPQTWRLLHQALAEPAAAPLAGALDRWIPPALRGNPPQLEPKP
jgi:aminoglycoside/choline kinase family phosphotransferase